MKVPRSHALRLRLPRYVCAPLAALFCGLMGLPGAAAEAPRPPALQALVQSVALDASRPLFVPTHARVTTTLRFPGAIGAPEGRGFTEDEGKNPGEYLVSWTPGESHLTVTPLERASALNLNVPYQGGTYVLYFYPVSEQFEAVALVNLVEGLPSPAAAPAAPAPAVEERAQTPLTPAKGLALLDKLKLLRVLPVPSARVAAERMALNLAFGPRPECFWPWQENAGLRVQVTHAVREQKGGALALAVRVQNHAGRPLSLDVQGLRIRCGDTRLETVLADAPVRLQDGEERELFLSAQCPEHAPLEAANDWLVSLPLTVEGPQ